MQYKVPVMSDLVAEGKTPDVIFWVGCAGSFDQRAQRVTIAFTKILNQLNINFAVLGTEEACTGDPARRAGNEFVFQMLAQQNIATMNTYGIKKIVTTCPHCFNTLKNEYPALGGNYEVVHHSTYLQELINGGKLKVEGGAFKGKRITYHDSCYLGRANEIYEAPRSVIEALDADLIEINKCRTNGLCCGAGGLKCLKKMNQAINASTYRKNRTTDRSISGCDCSSLSILQHHDY
jgi:heterodisulfide reductase subunit D